MRFVYNSTLMSVCICVCMQGGFRGGREENQLSLKLLAIYLTRQEQRTMHAWKVKSIVWAFLNREGKENLNGG